MTCLRLEHPECAAIIHGSWSRDQDTSWREGRVR